MIEKIIEEMKNTGHGHWADLVGELQRTVEDLQHGVSMPSGPAATIKPQLYTVLCAGHEFRDMAVVSEWEHFKKLKDSSGRIMILHERGSDFNNVFTLVTRGQDHIEYSVVLASLEVARQIGKPATMQEQQK